MGWCNICMKRRLYLLLDRMIKCPLFVFVQFLSSGNIVRNYRVPEFGRFLKGTWNIYVMVQYMYEKEIVFLMDGMNKCSLVVFVHPLSTETL